MFTGYSSIKWVHKPHQLLLWKSCMTLQGLNFNKFISRVIYFNVAKLKLHLSSKWSKIKGQKTFNSFFEYKELESSGHLWWIFNRMDISQDIADPRAPQAHLQGLPCPAGSSVCATPQNHSPATLEVCSFPRDYPIHIHSLVPQEEFFPWIFYSQTANSTKSRMQAQGSASAMLWLHTAYTGATPGILTPLPKPAKGMREKLVAWKKRSNIWNYYQEQQKLSFVWSRLHETFLI